MTPNGPETWMPQFGLANIFCFKNFTIWPTWLYRQCGNGRKYHVSNRGNMTQSYGQSQNSFNSGRLEFKKKRHPQGPSKYTSPIFVDEIIVANCFKPYDWVR